MVERIRTSRGPRRRRIALTEKGRALIEELAPEMSREHARLRARLGDDYDALRDLLARVERALTPPG
jgi:DNA-binding MarR family transcriptional regulator